MDRLQPGATAADQHEDGRATANPGERVEEGIVGTEHHARPKDRGIGESLSHKNLSPAAGLDVLGARGGTRADAGNVHQPGHPLSFALSGDIGGTLLMDSGIRDAALLHIGGHSIDGAIRTGDGRPDGRFVPYIRLNRHNAPVRACETALLWMAHGYAHGRAIRRHPLDDAAAEGPCATEYRDHGHDAFGDLSPRSKKAAQ